MSSGSDPTLNYDSNRLANVSAAMRELEHPSQIGPYFVLELLGEGGMGVVYRAEQREPIQRIVAIKLIKLGMDTRDVISRFQAERQVLAMMDHPNVARVIDAGATSGGSPYFVMEFVSGEPITRFADNHKLNVPQRLELFMQACEAVQHAHQKAIIHRDLKPSNILVTSVDGVPRVKVIDFGVAKAIDQTAAQRSYFTTEGRFVGTPEYMSPEQADGATDDIDTRGDVYSLGVVLYELLSGVLPFDGKSLRSAGYREIQRIIREVDPPRPSTRLSRLDLPAREQVAVARKTSLDALGRQLKGELEWIPLKAMRKERSQRYASASELTEDIQNYLANRPLRAGPESRAYLAKKFLRRNKTGVAASAAMFLLLLAGIATTTWQAVRAKRQTVIAAHERDVAQQERDNAEAVVKFFTDGVIGAADPIHTKGKVVTVQDAVEIAANKIDASLADHPLVDAAVRLSIADAFRSLGQYDRALPFAKRGYEIRRAQLGDDVFATIVALSQYANILIADDRAIEAEPLVRQIAASTERLKGPDDLETLAAQNNLGNVLAQLGRSEEALPIMRKHYEVLRAKFGDDSYDTFAAAENYGAVLFRLGRITDAEPMLRDAYERSLKRDGPDDPDTLQFGTSLAVALGQLDRHPDAAELLKKIYEGRQRVLGNDNPLTRETAKDYASELLFTGRADDGLAMLKQLVDFDRAHDPGTRSTLEMIEQYARALSNQNRHAEAAAMQKEVLDGRVKLLPVDHPDTLGSQVNYARELLELNRPSEALPLLREARQKFSTKFGANHRYTLMTELREAEALLQLNRAAEAEPLARAALDEFTRQFGAANSGTQNAARIEASILDALHRVDDAARLRREHVPATTRAS